MSSADIARLDVPLAVLTAQLHTTAAADLEAARLRLPLDDPDWHALDREEPFARLVIAHPERCSTAADYPNWTPGRAA